MKQEHLATDVVTKPKDEKDKKKGLPSLLSRTKGNMFGKKRLASFKDKSPAKTKPKPPVAKIKFTPTMDGTIESGNVSSLSDHVQLTRLLKETVAVPGAAEAPKTPKETPVVETRDYSSSISTERSSQFSYGDAFAGDNT
jgi:hypothetical protein